MRIRSSTRYSGAKAAILCGGALVVYLRDDFDHIPDPNCWDFAGGVAEPGETALETVIRETEEEFGITLSEADIIYEGSYISPQLHGDDVAFFVVEVEQALIDQIVFGDEGQRWEMMPVDVFQAHPQAVPQLKSVMAEFLAQRAP